MKWLIAMLVFVVIVRLVQVLLFLQKRPFASPYIRYEFLFSPAETAFLSVLDRAVGRHYRIFAKTRMADVIDLRRGLSPHARRFAFNRICAKHFDFVLCRPDDFSIAGVIELNDASHLERDRAQRDAFVINVCNAIGLPVLMVKARGQYSVPELRSVIERAFHD